MRKRTKRNQIPRYIWLGYLLAATLIFSGVSYAKYTDSDGANASVQTAGFDVEISVNSTADKSIDNTAGVEEASATITVENKSEVDICYDLVVNLQSALPAGVSITIDGAAAAEAAGTKLTYKNAAWALAIGAQPAEHTVKIIADESRVSQNGTVVITSFEVYAQQVEPQN